ncbi:DUF1775 domain-containing protein [Deinococcus metallilatus]|uniref:DUF1775 domain-containing protein n=1 Tax=Deinococcus metallilatus TaxID=1211322 RepID=A0AAJ5F3U8_9DEIO|nr:DUF1775 domain-containing protein [Deinococcus metallilatus]MBB5295909.1 uncharacterized protein YcnI [Deinococcus metallilatus]QBY08257.1 DUF1775 domain-containing protein [Deinococcus metallilatus]RXJ11988.1 DUF1775 domain-containing protein [Deinococcus metallilatus]TLK25780.1 DUF1775 domain-containing protein [Deinococcus metallilatus]GMA14557.1 hypothetical protein GCM10025871_08880 [Deinococcus metallilatus]
MRKLLSLTAAVLASFAFAHATVRTETGAAESLAGKSETYRLQVPVEKSFATTEIRLLVPAGVKVSRFLPVPGFLRTVQKDAQGNVTTVIWRGRLNPEEFQRFLFQATNPADAGTLVWKVQQTYADGSVVNWDDSSPETPASKTTVK